MARTYKRDTRGRFASTGARKAVGRYAKRGRNNVKSYGKSVKKYRSVGKNNRKRLRSDYGKATTNKGRARAVGKYAKSANRNRKLRGYGASKANYDRRGSRSRRRLASDVSRPARTRVRRGYRSTKKKINSRRRKK